MSAFSRNLVFYPTSPVHVRDFKLLKRYLIDWQLSAVLFRPLAAIAPGIETALNQENIPFIAIENENQCDDRIPADTRVVLIGAAFEYFSLELIRWAKLHKIPVAAIEEVAQLALNQNDINNYDAPFDRLFVASTDEQRRFVALGVPAERLCISGLIANDRYRAPEQTVDTREKELLQSLGIKTDSKFIVYTTSPLRHRMAIHNKDDDAFRCAVLTQLADASRVTGLEVIVKLHPNEDLQKNRIIIENHIPQAIVLSREVSMDQLFPLTAVLVNRGNSQTSLESVLRGVPTVIAACGLKTLYHNDGGALVVDNINDLAVTIARALAEEPPDTNLVHQGHIATSSRGSAQIIAQELTALSEKQVQPTGLDWQWLVKSMLFVGRHDRALSLCDKLAEPSSWIGEVRHSLTMHFKGDNEKRIAAWELGSIADPGWFFPHFELAHAYFSAAKLDQAQQHAEQAIKLHPPYHTLWHEIPMQVILMASQRKQQRYTEANSRLHMLTTRGLVDISPELLIEKAALLACDKAALTVAKQCLQQAMAELLNHPGYRSGDEQIVRIWARECVKVAQRCADAENESAGTQFLRDMFAQISGDQTYGATLAQSICAQADRWSDRKSYALAERWYTLAGNAESNNLWARFQMGRIALTHWRWSQALKLLHSVTRVPGATQEVVTKAFADSKAGALSSYWPTSNKSIVKPILLCLITTGYLVQQLFSGFRRFSYHLTGTVLVWIFTLRHFARRIRAESVRFSMPLRMIRARLRANPQYRFDMLKSCPICGGKGKFEYQNRVTPLYRCIDCDHVYARDLPDNQTLNELYGDFSYWEKDKLHQGITTIKESDEWQSYLDARLGILRRTQLIRDPLAANFSVFEIGCAEGMLLHNLGRLGVRAQGCEMNREVAETGKRELGVAILTEPFEDLRLPEQSFDLVMSFHTLEHLRYPAAVVAKVASILRPDGAVLIEVPCGEEEYENTDHLHFFSSDSLRLLLSLYFEHVEILPNAYTNGSGTHIASLYGLGRTVKKRADTAKEQIAA